MGVKAERGQAAHPPQKGVADLEDDFERETKGFTFKIIPLLSNALEKLGILFPGDLLSRSGATNIVFGAVATSHP